MRLHLAILLIFVTCTLGIGQVNIADVQGVGGESPLLGERVTLDSILITAIATGTIFTQSLPKDFDADPASSEGLWIQYSNTTGLEPGDIISCTGIVAEDGSKNTIVIAEKIDATGAKAIPIPIILDSLTDIRNRSLFSYENIEGQLVSLSYGIVTQPSGRQNEILINPLGERSFREPGVSFPRIISGIPQFDENPELITIVPGRFIDQDLTELPAGTLVVCEGVIIQRSEGYSIWPTVIGVDPNDDFISPPKDADLTLSIASINLKQFGTDDRNFSVRVEKTADYIRNVAGHPDILALQEIKDRNALLRLVESIGEIPEGGHYSFYFNPGNNNSSIHSCFLYKDCLGSIEFSRLGTFESLSTGGILHDRPPILMTFDYPLDTLRKMRILNLHLRSLNGIEGSNQNFVRQKRHEQAVSVARMINNLPEEDPLIVLGDYNAFQFTDGYVDVFAQISGKNSLGALIPVIPIVNDSLHNPLVNLPKEEQYSYIFNGHSQFLDHILIRKMDDFNKQEYFMLRGNADVPDLWEDLPLKKWRISDHDGIVAHLGLTEPLSCKTKEEDINELDLVFENPGETSALEIGVEVPNTRPFQLAIFSIDGRSVHQDQYDLGQGRHAVTINAPFIPGMYVVRLDQGNSKVIRKLILH